MAITVDGSYFLFAFIITVSPTANGLRVAVWQLYIVIFLSCFPLYEFLVYSLWVDEFWLQEFGIDWKQDLYPLAHEPLLQVILMCLR